MIVIICDGSSRGNPGPMRIGIVIWDRLNNSNCVRPTLRISKPVGIGTNNEAEWLAVCESLSYLDKQGISNREAQIYSDSQIVVKQILGQWQIRHDNCKAMYNRFNILKQNLLNKNVGLNFCWLPKQLIYLADKESKKH